MGTPTQADWVTQIRDKPIVDSRSYDSPSSTTNGMQEAVFAFPDGAVIMLPAGVITNTSTVILGAGHQFIGQGVDVTTILLSGSSPVFRYLSSTTNSAPYTVNLAVGFQHMTIQAKNAVQINSFQSADQRPQGYLVMGPRIFACRFVGTYGGVSDSNRLTTVAPSLSELQGYGVAISMSKCFNAEIDSCAFETCGIGIHNNGSDLSNISNSRFIQCARNIHNNQVTWSTSGSFTADTLGSSVKINGNDIIAVQRVGGVTLDTSNFTDIRSNYFEASTMSGSVTIGQYISSTNAIGTSISGNRFDSNNSATLPLISLDDQYNIQFCHNQWNSTTNNPPVKVGNTYWTSGNPNQYLFADNAFNFATLISMPENIPVVPGLVIEKLNQLMFRHNNIPNNLLAGTGTTSLPFAVSPQTGRYVVSVTAPNTGVIFQVSPQSLSTRFYTIRLCARRIGTGVTPVTVAYIGTGTTTLFSTNITYTATTETQTIQLDVQIPAAEKMTGVFQVTLDGTNAEYESVEFTAVDPGNSATGSGSAALGSNCPAITATGPFTWLKTYAPDGSVVYIPAWK